MFTMSAQDHPARPSRTQRTECQASERRNKTKYKRVVCLLLSSLAFSASQSLSPSPDKSDRSGGDCEKSSSCTANRALSEEVLYLWWRMISLREFDSFAEIIKAIRIFYPDITNRTKPPIEDIKSTSKTQ